MPRLERRRVNRHPRFVASWKEVAICIGALLLIAGFLLVRGPLLAQKPVNLSINAVDGTAFPDVEAYVTVVDGSGHAIADLAPDAFAVAENAVPVSGVNVELLENVGDPIQLALVLDTSGSMAGQALDDTQAAASQLIRSLGATDEVSILAFSSVVTQSLALTTDKSAAIDAVNALAAGGGTALNDALYEAVTMLSARPVGRKVVILLTDGEDTESLLDIDDGINAARDARIPVYTIGFGANIRPEVLERVALLTGGHFYASPTSGELTQSFDAVAKLLRYQYVLRYTSNQPADGTQHTLRVVAEVEGVRAADEVDFLATRREVKVAITSPLDGERVAGRVTLQPDIVAPVDIEEVTYWLDDTSLATVSAAPFNYTWDTQDVSNGLHTLRIRAEDRAGNMGEAEIELMVADPIHVTWAAPTAGAENLDGEVTLVADVEAVGQVARVVFSVDGDDLAEVSSTPYQTIWDTTNVATGEHELTVTAYHVQGYTDRATKTVSVAFRGGRWGLWAAMVVFLLGIGIVVPLALRRHRQLGSSTNTPVAGSKMTRKYVNGQVKAADGELVMLEGPEIGRRWSLNPGAVSLGRNKRDNDIVIPSSMVSRRHATIATDAQGSIYTDLQPTNPSRVNEVELTGPYRLIDGDIIRLGDVVLKYEREVDL